MIFISLIVPFGHKEEKHSTPKEAQKSPIAIASFESKAESPVKANRAKTRKIISPFAAFSPRVIIKIVFKPSLESSIKDKANAAIVKGPDTKEIRVELDKLFPGRGDLLKP